MTLFAVIAAVSSALVLGALWGLYGRLGDRAEGFVLAAGGGALMLAAVLELIVPAREIVSLWTTGAAVLLGAAAFTGIDYLIDERWGDEGGAAIASLATEIFPKAFRRDHHMAGGRDGARFPRRARADRGDSGRITARERGDETAPANSRIEGLGIPHPVS